MTSQRPGIVTPIKGHLPEDAAAHPGSQLDALSPWVSSEH
jgi:hypothetical protein